MSEPAPTGLGRVPHDAASELLSRRTSFAAWVLILAAALGSLAFFYSRRLSNLYGDGIAHVEGARRIFDSLTPGYAEIGGTWLPLFHLVASPLALNEFLWRSGLAGSLVSVAAFALTAWFLFRLAVEMNRSVAAGAVALVGYLACPSMEYLASTPLTEPLAGLWIVLMVYGLFRFQRSGCAATLVGAAVASFFGTLTRYDGWYVLPFAALFVLLAPTPRAPAWHDRVRYAALFCLIGGLGPVLWLLHNWHRFGNPFDFYTGPYSARAIYAHQLATTAFPYPTEGKPLLATRYYLEDVRLVIGAWPLALAALGLVAGAVDRSERARRSATLLLLVPLPFYVQSIAYAAVPLYVPTLFPHTYYNLRYGLAMLPGLALLGSLVLGVRLAPTVRSVVTVALLGLLVAPAAWSLWRGAQELPIVREGLLNTPCRSERQKAVADFLRRHYDGGALMMAAGKWPCAMPELGIPFRRTVTETNREYWKRLRSEPEKWVEWIVRSRGDAVDELMLADPQAFTHFAVLEQRSYPSEEGSVAIYRRLGEWEMSRPGQGVH